MSEPKIKELYLLDPKEGEVGIEIEMEGTGLFFNIDFWKCVREGSLRGDSTEYVLKTPCMRNQYKPLLVALHKKLTTTKDCKPAPSPRCGIHVHLNAQELTHQQVITWACLYLIFEHLLIKWCGEDREGNLFCLRSDDADYILDMIIGSLATKTFSHIGRDQIRYASINFEALWKYGSLEFRALPTTKDFVLPVCTWIDVLLAIKDASMGFKGPGDIIAQFSMKGPVAFANEVLGPLYETFTVPDVEQVLYQAVRRVQDVAFAQDLISSKPVEIKKDPFVIEKAPAKKRARAAVGNPGEMLWMDEAVDIPPLNL